MNFGGKSEITARNGQLSYKQELHYENRDKEIKTAKIETLLSMNRMSFEVFYLIKKVLAPILIIDMYDRNKHNTCSHVG